MLQAESGARSLRKSLVAGNWKMNGDKAMTASLCHEIVRGANELIDAASSSDYLGLEILVCPPYPFLSTAAQSLEQPKVKHTVFLGAQDLDTNTNGAFTGQVSGEMLRDIGCEFVILGHSERRQYFNESNALVAEKLDRAHDSGLTGIVCIGETLEQRESGQTDVVIKEQLLSILDNSNAPAIRNMVIAYEPVWAIGTGVTASPEQAQYVHQLIRELLTNHDVSLGEQCRILYGGSMKPTNAEELMKQPDIDGGLIGGAALKADDFLSICQSAAASR